MRRKQVAGRNPPMELESYLHDSIDTFLALPEYDSKAFVREQP